MSISPSKPQSGHWSCWEPEILGTSIWDEHCGHSTVIISGIDWRTTFFFLTVFFLGSSSPSSSIKERGEEIISLKDDQKSEIKKEETKEKVEKVKEPPKTNFTEVNFEDLGKEEDI